ncbi:hypothetical protein CLAFUW4_00104 [Fulvia fulva]|uniref:Uncharacterized protein n=1 Tax=Passalora fulva TaxID=5499 RepID=A0A9Q8L5D1_PASFU|nr:uncharacterized protein CLAFUR5_00103 [Fulvia fulva]KAK4635980.1 hypothetical protein CLAFUR4_00104 [Fulvia fulva]KAK4638564.1 hypothetical protein CLAFUR0_00102 [Fulvia fulva]UJO11133.1 hypothetical protein CLAFUR5_00103 [Fulvia fulva]WPV09106.1 hypothetical protein CLAFUW4_00104 [Fulvia fulva]WPV25118.1 hypothetical protein CLAFUW7_00104 [Fulvia fulva]
MLKPSAAPTLSTAPKAPAPSRDDHGAGHYKPDPSIQNARINENDSAFLYDSKTGASAKVSGLGRLSKAGSKLGNLARKLGRHSSRKRTRSGVLFSQQNPGVIVRREDTRECRSRKVKESHPSIFHTPKISHIRAGSIGNKRFSTKPRYFLIVWRTKKEVTEIPLYTFNDEGLTDDDFERF